MARQGGSMQGVYQEPFIPFDGSPHGGLIGGTVYTLNVPTGAQRVMLQATAQNIWYTLDGSTPAANSGFLMVANAVPIIIDVSKGVTLRFLEAAGGAYLYCQFGN